MLYFVTSVLLVSLSMSLVGYSFYNSQYEHVESFAIKDYQQTKFFIDQELAHPEKSGIDTILYGRTSLDARIALLELAEKSVDIQVYIWDTDTSGRLLGSKIYEAADRGVRVRINLDDNSVKGRDAALAHFTGHPNI